MKAVVIGEPSGMSMEEISKVFTRHKAVVDKFLARGDVIGIGPFADLGNMVKHQVEQSNQAEMFDSMLDMAPDRTERRLEDKKVKAAKLVRKLLPLSPDHMPYRRLWASVLAECIVKRTDVNAICGAMKKAGELASPDWGPGKRVPKDQYWMQLVAREPLQ